MRTLSYACAAVLAAAVAAPTARAATPDVISGGCYFDTTSHRPIADGRSYGVIGDVSATWTGTTPPAPIGATVTCWIDINGVPAPGTTHSYGDAGAVPGVQAGSDPVSFVATDRDFVALCHSVTFADGTTQSDCAVSGGPQFPPQVVADLLDTATGITCRQLGALAGSYPGGVVIDPTGDVAVPDPLGLGLDPVYDCPPYAG